LGLRTFLWWEKTSEKGGVATSGFCTINTWPKFGKNNRHEKCKKEKVGEINE